MLLYKLEEGTIKKASEDITEGYIVVGNINEVEDIFERFNIDKHMIIDVKKSAVPKLESFRDMDYIYVYNVNENIDKGESYWFFLRKEGLVLLCEKECEFKEKFLELMKEKDLGNGNIEKFLGMFLNQLIVDDVSFLRKLEEEVEILEERVLISNPKDINKKIIIMRKKLLFLKNYYGQLLEMAKDIEENDNNLINPKEMKAFRLFIGRLERINNAILMIRDYLTQVREAYQAQVDIRLNETMETFTVLTAIFLPLTLLTSWYGMNFKNMPELNWSYSYLGVFIIAIVIAISMWTYFKKRNMFK